MSVGSVSFFGMAPLSDEEKYKKKILLRPTGLKEKQ